MRTPFTHALAPLSLTLALGLAAACDEAELEDEVTLRPGCGWNCPTCISGLGNSPVIDKVAIHGVPLDGTANADGVALLGGVTSGGMPFTLGFDPTTENFYGADEDGGVLFQPSEMVNKALVLSVNGQERLLRITGQVDGVASWATGAPPISVYRAYYTTQQGAMIPLCPSANPDEQWFTLIADELVDRKNSELVAAPGWVSFACVNEAVGKMKLLNYHANGSTGTNPAERKATLRMLTADYCGTGDHFTVSGVSVAWRDTAGTVLPPFAENEFEAMWDENGAICLNTPRHVARSVVEAKCNIPYCNTSDEVTYPGAVWQTMLP